MRTNIVTNLYFTFTVISGVPSERGLHNKLKIEFDPKYSEYVFIKSEDLKQWRAERLNAEFTTPIEGYDYRERGAYYFKVVPIDPSLGQTFTNTVAILRRTIPDLEVED